MARKYYRSVFIMVLLLILAGCQVAPASQSEAKDQKKDMLQIGMCFDTFVLERWLRDRDVFTSTAADMGAEVNVQNANGDSSMQCSQVSYLMEKKVDAIVIVPVNTRDQKLADLLKEAKESGIVVVSYDRLIQDADVDLYISFDNVKVGALMAEAVLSQIPPDGKIAAIFGPKTDTNVDQMIKGVYGVLKKEDQVLVYEKQAQSWIEEYGFEYTNDCLSEVGAVDAIICGNDALAGASLRALAENQLAGEVCVVGQDADIQACQKIMEGYQHMTVYKPIQELAKEAARYTVKLIQGEELGVADVMDDGTYKVPFVKQDPVAVTKENMEEEIIDAQFHFRDEVYLYVGK